MSATPPEPLAVLLVDDHPLIRQGIAGLLTRLRPHCELHVAADCASALELAQRTAFRLVLLDLNLPDGWGLSALDRFRTACPGLRIVVLSGQNDAELQRTVLAHGAAGFIPKRLAPAAIEAALAAAVDAAQDAAPLNTPPPRPNTASPLERCGLTPRQRDVLRALATGLGNRDIAEQLALSEATVKSHVAAVMRALDVTSRTQVVGWLTRHGIPLDRV